MSFDECDPESKAITFGCTNRNSLLQKEGLNKISRDRKCIVYGGVFGGNEGRGELPETEMYCCDCVC